MQDFERQRIYFFSPSSSAGCATIAVSWVSLLGAKCHVLTVAFCWSYRSWRTVYNRNGVWRLFVVSPGSSTSCLMAAIAFSVPSFQRWKYFLLPGLPTLRVPSPLGCPPPPYFHDGRGFFHFVMLITEYYARKNVGPCSTACLDGGGDDSLDTSLGVSGLEGEGTFLRSLCLLASS